MESFICIHGMTSSLLRYAAIFNWDTQAPQFCIGLGTASNAAFQEAFDEACDGQTQFSYQPSISSCLSMIDEPVMSCSYLFSHLAKLANEKAGGFKRSGCSSFGVITCLNLKSRTLGRSFRNSSRVESLISVSREWWACLWPVTAQRQPPFPGMWEPKESRSQPVKLQESIMQHHKISQHITTHGPSVVNQLSALDLYQWLDQPRDGSGLTYTILCERNNSLYYDPPCWSWALDLNSAHSTGFDQRSGTSKHLWYSTCTFRSLDARLPRLHSSLFQALDKITRMPVTKSPGHKNDRTCH